MAAVPPAHATALTPEAGWTPAVVLALQRTAGNGAVVRLARHARLARQPRPQPLGGQPAPQAPVGDPRRPEDAPTYEVWLASFGPLPTFTASSGHAVLGDRAAGSLADATPARRASDLDRFIDHPTDAWVREHLPERLRETAYQLPADCADVLMILRHVWLAAHRRSERHLGYVLGYNPGGLDAEREQMRHAMTDLGSMHMAAFVGAYTDSGGRPLRTWSALQHVLHPGDLLVWEHHRDSPLVRSGGHSQTVVALQRAGGAITRVDVVQGNQPIGDGEKAEIIAREQAAGRPAPTEAALGAAPGRRVEAHHYDTTDLAAADQADPAHRGQRVWTWDDGHTRLVAAGPAAAAARPATPRRAARSLRDWLPAFAAARDRNALLGTAESAMAEARAAAEGGPDAGQVAPPDADVGALGRAAGDALVALAARPGALWPQSPAQTLAEVSGLMDGVAALAQTPAARTQLALAGTACRAAAAAVAGQHAAVPPRGGAGPGARLGDWVQSLHEAAPADLEGRFEAAVHEIRSLVTAGEELADADIRAVARTAGETLWRHAHEAQATADSRGASAADRRGGLADTTHTNVLSRMLAIAAGAAPAALAARLAVLRAELEAAARGATSVRFGRRGSASRRVNVLVTGFDPFNTADVTQARRSGEWNPSGAAALALDGAAIALGDGRTAAVEGIVFPVDFAAFHGGGGAGPIVERYVGAALAADPHGIQVVITVSEVAGSPAGAHVQLERYSVGMHQLLDGRLTPVLDAGPAIIEAPADVTDIARAAARPDRDGTPGIATPTIGDDLTLRLLAPRPQDRAQAAAALTAALGAGVGAAGPDGTIEVRDPASAALVEALRGTAQNGLTAVRAAGGTGLRIAFRPAHGAAFEAEVIRGPGGSFLSNEIAYRVQAMLAGRTGPGTTSAFHAHVPGGDADTAVVPPDVRAAGAAAALDRAARLRAETIATVRRLVVVAARRVPH